MSIKIKNIRKKKKKKKYKIQRVTIFYSMTSNDINGIQNKFPAAMTLIMSYKLILIINFAFQKTRFEKVIDYVDHGYPRSSH
jgi:hypothetical protein